MRLISYGLPGQERPGILLDDQILCLQEASQGRLRSLRQLIAGGKDALEQAQRWFQQASPAHLRPAEGVRLGPPLTDPTKIVCVGLNYRGHAEEQNKPIPSHPLLFSKATTTLAGHRDPIWYPVEENNLDYEVELAVVIAKAAFRTQPDAWREFIFGYTILNDISARDTQRADNKWFRGKSFDTSCPLGPYLLTADELPDPTDLRLQAFVNDAPRQDGRTSELIFPIPELLAFSSRNMTFQPGDILATGTPSGVGIHRKPPACLKLGDTVTLSIDHLGELTNTVTERPKEAIPPYPYSPFFSL